MSPVSSSMLARAEGNQRALKSSSARLASVGTKSLGRAGAGSFLRQGDAALSPPPGSREWDPELDAKAPTLSRSQSGRGSIKKPALTKAALMRLAAGEKKVEEEERRRQKSEFGISFDPLRSRAVTPSNSNLMTRSAYGASSLSARDVSQPDSRRCRTPQLNRRRATSRQRGREMENSNGMNNQYNTSNSMDNNTHVSASWRSFQPVMGRQSSFHGRQPHFVQSPPPMDRAEPDGVEDDKESQQSTVTKSLEGDYDHSKEYDPFKTAERQMQELLFGSPTPPTPTPNYGSNPPGAVHQPVQKPQPVRPASSNPNQHNLKTTTVNSNISLYNLKTAAGDLSTQWTQNHPSISNGPITIQSPARGHPHIKPSHPNLREQRPSRMFQSPENEITRNGKKMNWRQYLPALLSRQQANNSQQQTNNKSKQQAYNSSQEQNNSRYATTTATASTTNKQTKSGMAR